MELSGVLLSRWRWDRHRWEDVLLKQTCERGHDDQTEYKPHRQSDKVLALLPLALLFACHELAREPVTLQRLLVASLDSCWFGRILQHLLDPATTKCLMFWTGLLIFWQQRVGSPQRTASKQVHNPYFLLTFLLPLPLVGGLERRFINWPKNSN